MASTLFLVYQKQVGHVPHRPQGLVKLRAWDVITFILGICARRTRRLETAGVAIKMGLELHGYLQAALQGCGLDRVIMPQADSNGFEVWRLLHERFKPHTALSALSDLREVVFGTNLFNTDNFTQKLLDWEHKLTKLTERYKMDIPDMLKYLIVMIHAPLELQSHVCV